MAYTFLCNEDCTIIASRREVIMQREKCVSEIWFLVPPEYKTAENNMQLFNVVMEYILPISRKYNVIELVRDEEDYKDHLRYILPLDTNLSSEHGDVELQLTFVYVGLNADGNGVQKVRKTKPTKLHITPIAAWSDIIPDSNLSALDQRIIKTQAQINELGYYAQVISENQVNNLRYDDVEETLQLMAGDKFVGDAVSVRDMLDDGIPVVDLNSSSENSGDNNNNNNNNCNNNCNCGNKDEEENSGCNCGCDCEDNVVEFDPVEKEDGCDCGCEENVVEF
jgi:hypothetical protein